MRSSVEERATANFTSNEIIVHGSYRPPTTCYTIFISEFDTIGDAVQITISQRKEDGVEAFVKEHTYFIDSSLMERRYRLQFKSPIQTRGDIQFDGGQFGDILTDTANYDHC
jgi:hypothetical protein